MALPLKESLYHKTAFLNLFNEALIDSHELTTKSQLSLFMLRIDGGKFDYERMYEVLGEASLTYAVSRSFYKQKYDNHTLHAIQSQVGQLFRNADLNDGEGGELLLYCFLESHLGAPKILSKMELKTDGNDYVKGADGIHILSTGDLGFHLIFGESKMIGDSTEKGSSFRKAVSDAFKSIHAIETEGFGNEIRLVDSNLMKESFDESTISELKKIIVPSGRDKSISKQNAYGLFLGFEIDIIDWDVLNMTDVEFEENIKAAITSAVENKYDHIIKKIKEYGLEGRHFYFYTVPFLKDSHTNIDITRKAMIKRICHKN